MRKRIVGLFAAIVAMVTTVGIAPGPAYAEANPPGCPKGSFCMYSGVNQTGTLLVRTYGDWTGFREGVQSVFNNGSTCSGCDHVDFLYYYVQENTRGCFHFNPGPGIYKANFRGGAIAKSVEWRGEC